MALNETEGERGARWVVQGLPGHDDFGFSFRFIEKPSLNH